jgi:hypothetical protein
MMTDDDDWPGFDSVVSEDYPGEVEIHVKRENFHEWGLDPIDLHAALQIGEFVLRDALKNAMVILHIVKADQSLRFVVDCNDRALDIRFDPTKPIDQLIERTFDGGDWPYDDEEKAELEAVQAWLEFQAKRLRDLLEAGMAAKKAAADILDAAPHQEGDGA